MPRLPIENPLLDNYGTFDPVNLINPYAMGGGEETVFITNVSSGWNGGEVGDFGFKFTVGGAGFSITQLGVLRTAALYMDLTVTLYGSDGTTPITSAVVDFDSVANGEYAFAAITPVALSPSDVRHVRVAWSNYNTVWSFIGSGELDETGVATVNATSDSAGADTGGAAVNFKYIL